MSSSGLEEALAKARDNLTSGLVMNEARVQASVIRPILRELGWDDADPQQWQVEYQVDNGRVDEALIGPLGKPLVFVEAKRPGELSPKAEDQLFRYANNKGVPLLVLTDGDIWDMYLSMAEGEPVERRFARCKLTESSDLRGVAKDLRTFLERGEVLSGNARKAAEARLEQVKHREIGKGGLDAAWAELLRGPDDILRDLLIEKVEENVGSRPGARDAEEFLRLAAAEISPTARQGDVAQWLRAAPVNLSSGMKAAVTRWLKQLGDPASNKPSPDGTAPKPTPESGNLRGFRYRGVNRPARDGWETLTTLASVLEQHKPGFLKELAGHGSPKRKWPRAVRHDDPLMQTKTAGPSYRPVEGHADWLLLVHGSTRSKLRWMRQVTEMAGLVWNSDVEPVLEGPSG